MSALTLFFFNDTATTEIYTLSLHDALPISCGSCATATGSCWCATRCRAGSDARASCSRASTRGSSPISCSHANSLPVRRSEEHTSELQSQSNLVCRLLLEKKKKIKDY